MPIDMTRKELGDHAEALVASHLNGTLAATNTPGYDLTSPAHGRVQVKARSHSSKHLNWFHVRNVHEANFDSLVLMEFDTEGAVAGAWGMTHAQVAEFAHSVVPALRGGRITKLAVRGDWKQRADLIALGSGS
jgi:hypothetical protein